MYHKYFFKDACSVGINGNSLRAESDLNLVHGILYTSGKRIIVYNKGKGSE